MSPPQLIQRAMPRCCAKLQTVCCVWTICLSCTLPSWGQDQDSQAQKKLHFFEQRIRPVLSDNCYECHSANAGVAEGELFLDSREAVRRGGSQGPAVVPGNPDDSILMAAIRHLDPDLAMPPRGDRLSDQVIGDFRRWIEEGAVDPREEAVDPTAPAAGRAHWAYRPIRKVGLPHSQPDWVRTAVDPFVWRKLQERELRPSPDASPQVLLRRLYFDLLGLPPTPTEQAHFTAERSAVGFETAWRNQVESLLANPAFGERWGRCWLDVARYAESSGREANISFPYAWRYRDYVIDAWNADTPFATFLAEQLAGDLLPSNSKEERTRLLVATGFLALGPKNLDEMDEWQFRADVVDEQIDAVSRVFMASSLACARCHDHKFDPYTMQDYYALAGIFRSTRTYFGTAVSPVNRVGGDPLRLPDSPSTAILHRSIAPERVAKLKAERTALLKEKEEKGAAFTLRDVLRVFWRTGAIDGQLEKVDDQGRALPLAMGVLDDSSIRDAHFLERGDVKRVGDLVPRRFPDVLKTADAFDFESESSGRLELARWLNHPQHPLTYRVIVNRVWSHLFGNGLVSSVDDFGVTGQPPSHPELLDYLARRFREQGGSFKVLLRELVCSRTYRQSSRYDEASFERDPQNRLLWRMPKRRIEAESMRDAMLAAAEMLDRRRPVGSLVGKVVGDRPISLIGLDKRIPADLDHALHRAVYLPVMRDRLPDVLDLFDFAEPSLVVGRRESTNVPTQALYLMNSEFVQQRSRDLARRLAAEADSTEELVRLAYSRCFGRAPTLHEVDRIVDFLDADQADAVTQDRIAVMCQALLCTVEFRVLD